MSRGGVSVFIDKPVSENLQEVRELQGAGKVKQAVVYGGL